MTNACSGGQRKRVNIGLELVARPSVLFMVSPATPLKELLGSSSSPIQMPCCCLPCVHALLLHSKLRVMMATAFSDRDAYLQDEPTSGLDATAATDILTALRRCAAWVYAQCIKSYAAVAPCMYPFRVLYCAPFIYCSITQAEGRPSAWMQDGGSGHEHRDGDSPATL